MTDTLNTSTVSTPQMTVRGHIYLVRHLPGTTALYRPAPDQGEAAEARVYLAGVASDNDSFLILDADRYTGHAWSMESHYTEDLYPQYLGWRGFWQSRDRLVVLADLTEMGAVVPAVADTDNAALIEEARVLRAETETMREQATDLRRQVREAGTRATAADVELDRFKRKAREVAIEKAEEHDWCSVIDEILSDMGLEPRTRTYEVSVDVTFSMRIDVEASSEDQARDLVNDGDRSPYVHVPDFIEGAPFADNSVYNGDINVEITDVGVED